jgi:hypothetical protein
MLYNEIIYSIREQLRQTIDDSNIDDREIIFNINIQRSLFYRNQYNQRNRIIDEDIKQNLYVKLQESSEDLCSTTDCTIIRSVNPLPKSIELHHKNAILGVSSTNISSKQFSLVNWTNFIYSGNSRYSKNEVFVSVNTDGYLYLKVSNKLAKFINTVIVQMILENPLDIKTFVNCGDTVSTDCFDLETFEYPIKQYAFAYIKEQVVNTFINKLSIPEDKQNDGESQ